MGWIRKIQADGESVTSFEEVYRSGTWNNALDKAVTTHYTLASVMSIINKSKSVDDATKAKIEKVMRKLE